MDQSQVKCLLQEALYLCPCLTLDLSEEGGRIFAKILFFLATPIFSGPAYWEESWLSGLTCV